MLNIQIDEETVKTMLEKAINEKVEKLARDQYFLSFKQLEKYLNLSRPTISERLLKNGLPYYKNGSHYLFKRDEVDAFLDDMTARMSATNNDIKFFNKLKGGVELEAIE